MRILFISHTADRTGAVAVLLNMQQWLARHSDVKIVTLLLRDGPLAPEFRRLGSVITVQYATFRDRMAQRWGSAPYSLLRAIRSLRTSQSFDLIYSNTFVNGQALELLRGRAPKVITHVHELGFVLSLQGQDICDKVMAGSDHFIACSNAVKNNLVETQKISGQKISVMNSFSAPCEEIQAVRRCVVRAEFLAEVGIPETALVVGCCSSGHLHKGYDLLTSLAMDVAGEIKGRPVHFLHVGPFDNPHDLLMAQQDAVKAGVADRVHYIGYRSNATSWISIFDVHALLSREDSCPLVMLEAAALAIPTVCFDTSGGAPEFCSGGYGVIVPYVHIGAMGNAVERLLEDQVYRTELGEAARGKLQSHYDVSVVMPRWMNLVYGLCGQER